MTITLEFFAQLREASGQSRETISIPEDCTVEQLLRDLAASRPKLSRFLLNPDGSVSSSLAVAVNERQVKLSDAKPLQDGDELLLMPAVSGG